MKIIIIGQNQPSFSEALFKRIFIIKVTKKNSVLFDEKIQVQPMASIFS
jgi:hypothetical protein